MNTLRKIFASAMVLAMAFSFFVGTTTVKAATVPAGSLIKMQGLSTVYYLGADNKRYVFVNEKTFLSWYPSFSGVQTISQSELESLPLGSNVTMRPGTKLVKITTNPKVYAVEPGGKLRGIVSEANAISLWGANWASKVVDVPDGFFTNYTIQSDLTAGMYPAGSLVKMANSSDVFYFDGTNYRAFASEAAFTSNRFNFGFVQTAPSTMTFTPMGTVISGVESGLVDTSSGAGGSITGSGLSVALSSNTPASTTYLRSTNVPLHAQAVAPFATFNFTASNDGDAVVNTVKLTRSGISADTDLQDVYLYDGDTQLAEMTSFSNKVITFNNTAGLFTVPKGTTRSITVKGDISTGSSNVSGIILGINAASDVVASGATVTGSFPMNGNSMAVNTVSDLGYADITATTTYPLTMDPGKLNQELWRFSVTANSQDMALQQIKLTTVGTISQTDLANFMLQVGGTQVGTTVASMNSAKEIVFDFSAAPYIIPSGQTKIFVLKGDVLNGTGRAFKFTIRKSADFVVKDNNYGVFVAPTVSGAAFTLVQPTPGAGTAINNGTVTVSVDPNSPSGNVPSAGTNISLAKFDYKANGEDIKISTIRVTETESTVKTLKNGKLYFNGSQVGSNVATVTSGAENDYTMTQVITAGTTAVIEYRADITNGSGIPAGETMVVSLVGGSTDATGQQSLASILTNGATGRTMTSATGLLTEATNTALGNYTAGNPTGVKGATGVKVASMVINSGSAEGATVSSITVQDAGGAGANTFGQNFQNLTLKNGATVLATPQGTLSAASNAQFNFSLSPAITVPAGGQYVVDFYADILTGAPGYATAFAGLKFANMTATTLITSTDAYPTATPANLQNIVIAANGSLTITADSSTPIAQQVVMGDAAGATFTALQLAAGTSEDVNVTRIAITDDSAHSANLSNVSLWNGATQVGQTLASFNGSNKAVFNLATPLTITKGTNLILTVKAFVNAFPNATSNQASTLALDSNTDIDSIGASSGQAITESVTTATGNAMTVVKTKITVTKAADSPSGSSTGSTQQIVAKWNVTNSANVGNYQATLTNMTVNMSSTIILTTGAVYYVTFYKDSVSGTVPNQGNSGVGSGNALASIGENFASTCTTANQLTCVATTGSFVNHAILDAAFNDVVVAAGATRTIIVVADTSLAATNTHFSAGLDATSVGWNDGVNAITTVDSLPIAGSTLTY